jgi:hypothetical protein
MSGVEWDASFGSQIGIDELCGSEGTHSLTHSLHSPTPGAASYWLAGQREREREKYSRVCMYDVCVDDDAQ